MVSNACLSLSLSARPPAFLIYRLCSLGANRFFFKACCICDERHHLSFWVLSSLLSLLLSPPLSFRVLLVVAPGPGPGPAPMSQFGTISRQISRHNPSNSSVSMVSATGTYRRAPSVTSQSSIQQQHQQQQQPHVNGGPPGYAQNSSKVLLPACEDPQTRSGSSLQL